MARTIFMKNLFDRVQLVRLDRLARRMKYGDESAARKLYEELVRKVFGFCMHRVRNRELAEDLTQEIFLKLVRSIHLYEERKGHFVVWFWKLARNIILDHFRAKEREARSPVTSLEELKSVLPSNEDLNRRVEEKMQYARLTSFLSDLQEEERELFELRYVAELSYRDIAVMLGKSEGTLRVAVMRLKKKMRNFFET